MGVVVRDGGGVMVLGAGERDLEATAGRPGGRLAEWFPVEELTVDEARLRRAELSSLVGGVATSGLSCFDH